MLLAIDVGNTNIVLGVFDGAELVQSWRLQTVRERTSDELGLLVDGLFAHSRIERVQIRAVIIGSVVPPLTGTIRDMAQRYFGVTALIVEPGVNTNMPILYENPAEVGADRIVNSVAAFEKFGGPCIVVDFGTATTFDCVPPPTTPTFNVVPRSRSVSALICSICQASSRTALCPAPKSTPLCEGTPRISSRNWPTPFRAVLYAPCGPCAGSSTNTAQHSFAASSISSRES